MNKRSLIIFITMIAFAVFVTATIAYKQKQETKEPVVSVAAKEESVAHSDEKSTITAEDNSLVRAHSPVLGAVNGSVTIVEFLDPSCEACRAFFPFVEQILKEYPEDVRLVIRYAAFHEGSDEAVRILEASRKQDLYLPVLDALFALQPQWAVHGSPQMEKAWEIAASKGVDVERGKVDAASPEIAEILSKDTSDLQVNNIRQTPTFFVNGQQLQLTSIGPQQLRNLVEAEIKKAKAIEPANHKTNDE